MQNKLIRYFLENKLITTILLVGFIGWGLVTAPFSWNTGLPNDPVPVDAIPDIGENQQIVFTEWSGRSPQDIDDQITYPLTTYLLGIPGVKSVRSSSIFGFSSIYIIFEEEIEFYWSRSRIVEKLNALPKGLLPDGVQPALGPDATGLGQIFWYTLEGRDNNGNPTGGWDLHEIREVQDFYVKYGLNSAKGVSEVASIGGFVKEYQIEVDLVALNAHQLSLNKVVQAVRKSNRDVGAKTIEINQVEYLVRGLGYIKNLDDLKKTVVDIKKDVPIFLEDVAHISFGPANRRGILDKDGAEVVGAVVVARYGANPLEVINNVKAKIGEISSGLPVKTLADGSVSKLTIVPFYDRTDLIYETLGTLEEALTLQILITVLVIIVMIYNLRASIFISAMLPIVVLMVFIMMRYFGVDANIVALSGIAIAIGTIVDLGIILSENVLKKLNEAGYPTANLNSQQIKLAIFDGAAEVSSAIVTAVSTTIISFIPVFSLQAAEGKLFGPLAWTKTFSLVSALLVTLIILPTISHWFFGFKLKRHSIIISWIISAFTFLGSLGLLLTSNFWSGSVLLLFAISAFSKRILSMRYGEDYINILGENGINLWLLQLLKQSELIISLIAVVWLLAGYWLPLGPENSLFTNFGFVSMLVAIVIGFFVLIEYFYTSILKWCLSHKKIFLAIPSLLIVIGFTIWLGFNTIFGFLAKGFDQFDINIGTTAVWSELAHTFPGIGEEFMPALDEGSFLLMPSTMPHSGVDYNKNMVAMIDKMVTNIPEVSLTVGKVGRVESALDPAPISMFENVVNYKPEYVLDENGHRLRFKTDEQNRFLLSESNSNYLFDNQSYTFFDEKGQSLSLEDNERLTSRFLSNPKNYLIPKRSGKYFRNWRSHINSPDDIWKEITATVQIPGLTSAPKLQLIQTRLMMLQTGMRAPMGIKVFGPELKMIENFGLKLEEVLKTVPSIKPQTVFADRIVGKPYIHLKIDRQRSARYGLNIDDVQQFIETALGGMALTKTVEGRERYSVRVRYQRELRDNPESIENMLITTSGNIQIPLSEVVDIQYVRGPQMIKSENTFLLGYVLFDKQAGYSEVEVIESAQKYIDEQIKSSHLIVPPGINFTFSGSYENQIRAKKRLSIIIPIVMTVIFLILYFQFRSATTSLMVFTGILLAFSGGFIMLWLYAQPWFADFTLLGINMRDLFQIHTINLSVAVWVGFIALFGLATDNGVLISTYLDQSFEKNRPNSLTTLRDAVIQAGQKRIKPAVMTTVTTIIALMPILTSTGKGSDIMLPMAIPAVGGMLLASITYFLVPVLYSYREEKNLSVEKTEEN